MAVQKNFVVKNGIEVNTNLIFADTNSGKVGIATTVINNTLSVNGGIGAKNITISGISTLNNVVLDGYLSIENTTGSPGQVLVSTGTGVSWSKLSKNSAVFTAFPGQTTFLFNYDIGSVEVFINGVKLIPEEFTAINGTEIILNDSCFGGETIEILAAQTLPVALGEDNIVSIGMTVQNEGTNVGTAGSITLINFTGAGVTVTSLTQYGVEVAINGVTNPPGKTLYVSMNGDNLNDGLTLD